MSQATQGTQSNTKNLRSGTEGIPRSYALIVESALGWVGVRDLGGGRHRVRFQLADGAQAPHGLAAALRGYKQPGNGQNRFSVVANDDSLDTRVVQTVEGFLAASPEPVRVASSAPARFRKIVVG